jgi:hypothetical protein
MKSSSRSTRPIAVVSLLALVGGLAACASTAPARPAAPGMVRSPQDSDTSIKGRPDNLGGDQDSSFRGRPQTGAQGGTPAGAGYNNPGGEMMPQSPTQIGGGDTHYHVHYHGTAAPAPTGYAPPTYGAPRPNNNLQSMNPYNQMSGAPIGTGGGGAGWYGPGGDGGPTGIRQGFGVGGWGTGGAYGSYSNSGWWNGYTD